MGKLAGLTFNEIKVEGYERVVEIIEEEVGLHAIIALHDTRLGPALGGVRVYPYQTFELAFKDVLRLSEGMTFKSAVAETGTGGGKGVIIADNTTPKDPRLLLAFAEAVNHLNGNYICAEDIGMFPKDLEIVRKGTPFVVGLPHPQSSGDPGRFTAFGGFLGIKATARKLWGSDSLEGRSIAIQGLGSVGMHLAGYLFWEGVNLIVSDINSSLVEHAVREFNAKAVNPEEIYQVKCDIFSPCALGGIVNPETIPQFHCKAIAGLANNQLLSDADGEFLMERGILYAPDFVINAGGLLNVCAELNQEGYNPQAARHNIQRIYDLLLTIFTLSEERKLSTNLVAIDLAEYNLERQIGKRTHNVVFHH